VRRIGGLDKALWLLSSASARRAGIVIPELGRRRAHLGLGRAGLGGIGTGVWKLSRTVGRTRGHVPTWRRTHHFARSTVRPGVRYVSATRRRTSSTRLRRHDARRSICSERRIMSAAFSCWTARAPLCPYQRMTFDLDPRLPGVGVGVPSPPTCRRQSPVRAGN